MSAFFCLIELEFLLKKPQFQHLAYESVVVGSKRVNPFPFPVAFAFSVSNERNWNEFIFRNINLLRTSRLVRFRFHLRAKRTREYSRTDFHRSFCPITCNFRLKASTTQCSKSVQIRNVEPGCATLQIRRTNGDSCDAVVEFAPIRSSTAGQKNIYCTIPPARFPRHCRI